MSLFSIINVLHYRRFHQHRSSENSNSGRHYHCKIEQNYDIAHMLRIFGIAHPRSDALAGTFAQNTYQRNTYINSSIVGKASKIHYTCNYILRQKRYSQITMHSPETSFEVPISSYHSVIRKEIELLLPSKASSIMDIGCGTGDTLSWLKTKFGAKTIGVEINPKAASIASKNHDMVYQTDIENDFSFIEKNCSEIDILLLLDILEHLENPWAKLQQFSKLLSKNGLVIASIPNVRNLKVTLPLIFFGSWEYEESGILDRTHLRFFTKRSAIALFEENGFRVERVVSTGPVKYRSVKSKLGLAVFLANKLFLGALEGFVTHQYLILAKKCDS